MTTEQAYKHGYDCGKNGSNTTNSNYSIFSTNELAKWWGNGKRDAEAGLPPVDLTHPSVATTLPSAGETDMCICGNKTSDECLQNCDKLPTKKIELKNIEAYSFDEGICQPIEASAGERFKMPTDKDIIDFALIFNDGNIQDRGKLADMVAMCNFIIDRLYENGDIKIPSSKEK